MRTKSFSAIAWSALVLMPTGPAGAHWHFTTWGMSPKQVVAKSGGRAKEIDTPETKHPRKAVQCYGQRASDFNARLVSHELVRLVRDSERRDRYGRLLAYVYRARDGLFVNAELARLGYARPLAVQDL